MKERNKSSLLVEQRSGAINNEITNRKPLPPFRHLDGVLRRGKYKGRKLSQIPKSYLQYMLREWDLNNSQRKQVQEQLDYDRI
jgi:hypothetical protein